MPVRFDESLATLAAVVERHFGQGALQDSAIIRDAGGRLSVILPAEIKKAALKSATKDLQDALGAYCRPDSPVADRSCPGASSLLDEAKRTPPLRSGDTILHVLDRRIVGADWLLGPAPSASTTPRIVFGSLKGGVGRSTALCVMAAHLSKQGRRVLAVDLDLEAPGIGTMLLGENELPNFGTLDYLVENSISGIDNAFITDLVGNSFLGSEGARVSVIPAIGQATVDNPSNALAKIARAYIEDPKDNGTTATLSDQVCEMVALFENTEAYDVILIDSRAGLHESAPASLLALGADVLLFGTDQPQTYLSYRLLFSHLARFPVDPNDDWRDRLNLVLARSPESKQERQKADDRFESLYELIDNISIEPPPPAPMLTAEDFEIEWDEQAALPLEPIELPSAVLHVYDDSRYHNFDPVRDPSQLTSRLYSAAFQEVIDFADLIVDRSENQQG